VLQSFLEKKPLYYTEIDYTRMPRAYASIASQIKLPKIVHLIGTNGKGTTGRFLAQALFHAQYNVGHYTSPHILEFNERIWLNGNNASHEILEEAHNKLLKLLDTSMAQELSYFEYTTLLSMIVFQECDYVVLEAGLGGEHDATAVFKNILTVVTPIDKDHEAFLGSTIEEIATTKLNAIQTSAILAKQKHQTVYEVADKISKTKHIPIKSYQDYLDKKDYENGNLIAKNLHLSEYLQENLLVSICVLNSLHVSYTPESFYDAKLFGRMSYLAQNIILDVGHNLLAAEALYKALFPQKFVLIYNTYKDKEYEKILSLLQPIIKRVEIIEVDEDRIVNQDELLHLLYKLNIQAQPFKKIQEDENYLVFGSFSVAEAFLRRYNG